MDARSELQEALRVGTCEIARVLLRGPPERLQALGASRRCVPFQRLSEAAEGDGLPASALEANATIDASDILLLRQHAITSA